MSGNLRLVLIMPLASRGVPDELGSSEPGLISQQSSMFTYVQPCSIKPEDAITSAAARTLSSLTAPAQQFQLFQPIGGVSAMRSPTAMRSGASAVPRALVARSVTLCSPRSASLPVMWPVCGSSERPSGSASAANFIGRSPVAAIMYISGCPGRTPKTLAPLIRGSGGDFGVRMYGSTFGAARIFGGVVKYVKYASAQSA